MSRREYPVADRYDEREADFYRRPRHERNYEELDVDITRSRYPERRAETLVKERDPPPASSVGGRRQPDFLREDYGKTTAGPLVVRREEVVEQDRYSRAPTRRRSPSTTRSTVRPPVVEREELVIREREREREGPARARSDRGGYEEEIVFREREGPARARSRPPPTRRGGSDEEIDIKIRREEAPAPALAPPPPRSEYREREVEEITFRRGGGDRPREVEREEVRFVDTRSPPPREPYRGRDEKRDIDIDIDIREREGRGPYRRREDYREREKIDIDIREERSRPPPRREPSRGQLVARDREEWIVRRQRTPSPPPPPRDYEKEEIIIRRRERSPSPSPVREPTPPPPPPPPPEPIVRPPIIQEVITHHRVIDHGVERARSPTPPPPPAPPSPPREENLEIEIKRQGTRNGRPYEEDIIFEQDLREGGGRSRSRAAPPRERSLSRSTTTRRGQSIGPPARSRYDYDDPVSAEAEYYNRKIRERGYPGEAYNGATRDWGLVDIPPGTEKVRMDGAGGGAQEITWQRYTGDRQGRFISGDRDYRSPDFGAERERERLPPPAPAPPSTRGGEERSTEVRITERRIDEGTRTGGGRTRDKMWTEITKDLVIREAIEECGYEYEETGDFFYVMEYLRYEDVLRLVTITEDIRRERRERIREIQWEREEMERLPAQKMLPPPPPAIPPPPRGAFEEKVYERDYVYERDGRRFR